MHCYYSDHADITNNVIYHNSRTQQIRNWNGGELASNECSDLNFSNNIIVRYDVMLLRI